MNNHTKLSTPEASAEKVAVVEERIYEVNNATAFTLSTLRWVAFPPEPSISTANSTAAPHENIAGDLDSKNTQHVAAGALSSTVREQQRLADLTAYAKSEAK